MRAGEIIGSKYELVSRVGQGGMGSVWRVAHRSTGRDFAIKFLNAAIAASEDSRQRFLQEAKASARINHPNIIDIFDVGETDDGTLYLVMEMLEGISLGEALRSEPPFNARELLLVLAEVCTALAAAHAAGVVHRDIKPPNIFLHRDRGTGFVTAKLLDFGVSKVLAGDDGVSTHTGSLLGSPRYMSPEQAISAASADGRSDIWSLGVVLFESLTGRFPHDGDSSNSLVVAIATRPPKPIQSVAPQLPHALRMLVDDCLKPQGERIQTADNLLDRILAIVATHDLSDIPLARPTVAKGKSRIRPESFILRTSPESIPGLATSLLRARRSGQGSGVADSQALHRESADLSFGNSSTALTPHLGRDPSVDESTRVHRVGPQGQPQDDLFRPLPPSAPTAVMPGLPPDLAGPSWMQSSPAHGSAPQQSQVGVKGTMRIDDPRGLSAAIEAQRAAQLAQGGPGVPTLGRTLVFQDRSGAPLPHDPIHVQPADPMVESISSINVARGAQGFDMATAPGGSGLANERRTPMLWGLLAVVGLLAAAGSAAAWVTYSRRATSVESRSTAAGASETPASEAPIASAAPRAPAAPSASNAAAVASASPSPPSPSASSPSGSVDPTPLETSRPGTSVTSLPAASAQPPRVLHGPVTPPTKKDPLKDLGSGLGQ